MLSAARHGRPRSRAGGGRAPAAAPSLALRVTIAATARPPHLDHFDARQLVGLLLLEHAEDWTVQQLGQAVGGRLAGFAASQDEDPGVRSA
jgi:hypothetical protein